MIIITYLRLFIVPQSILSDVRDSKTYVVRKLADGNCWMVQNLDLDLSTSVALNSTTSDLTLGRTWTPQNNTQTTEGTVWAQDGGDVARSMEPGNIYLLNGVGTGTVDEKGNFQTSTTGQPWEHVGNYYNWYAATAGTGLASAVNGGDNSNAASSICPKGWGLPWAFQSRNLLAIYNITNDAIGANDMLKSPLNFIRSGFYSYNHRGAGAVVHQGTRGFWWIPVPSTSATAYTIAQLLDDEYQVADVAPSYKGQGFSVRCVAH